MSEHPTEETLVLLHYGEAGDPEAVAHLVTCEECQAEAARLASVLSMVEVPVPEPDAGFELRTWDRLAWRLRGARRNERRFPWIAAAAALFVIALATALWIGRPGPAPDTSRIAATAPPAVEPRGDRVLLLVVSHHLDRTERVLLELARTPASGDLSTGRMSAGDLAAANRLYRLAASDRDPRLAALLEELEPILVELSNAGDDLTAEDLQSLQKRIEDRGLIFKLRVSGARVRGQKASAGPTT